MKTHCANGHPLTAGNARVTTGGRIRCCECRRIQSRTFNERHPRAIGVGKGYRAPHKVLFWRKTEYDPETGCVVWIGARNSKGYGTFRVGGHTTSAHRWIWERNEGPIPEGMEIDHLCRNRACVNVLHLEVVTHRVNVLRGETNAGRNARKTHCLRGHEFTPENTRVDKARRRTCLACQRARNQGLLEVAA